MAEHRSIAAIEERRAVATWNGEAKPTRFSPRCGTNFAALVLPVTWLAERVWPLPVALWTPLAVTGLSLAVTMELWRAVQENDLAAARRVNDRIWPTAEAFYSEPSVDMHNRMKEALVLLGKLPRAVVRPPLVKLPQAEIERIRTALIAAGLLKPGAAPRFAALR